MSKIPGGYFIKARQIKKSDIAHAPPHVREIWDYLIREANHSGKKKHGHVLVRGQILTTYEDILEGLHWMVGWRKQRYSKAQCETAMKFLRKPRGNGPMITSVKTTRGMIITIINYSYFQDPKNYENHKENHNENHNETGDAPQQHDRIDKNENNGKNDKNVNTPPESPQGDEPEPPSPPKTWKTDFEIYLQQCERSYRKLQADFDWQFQQERINPNIDIPLSLEKAKVNYWGTKEGWKKKKRAKSQTINWKYTWQNAIAQPMNKVYKDAVQKAQRKQDDEPGYNINKCGDCGKSGTFIKKGEPCPYCKFVN